ncbi:MAG: alkane 1-monooxygenase, partial [Lysobacteraceae bacterium]
MSHLKALGFVLVFVVPALMPLSAWLGRVNAHPDLLAWFPLFFLFVLLPVLDYALGRDSSNPLPEQQVSLDDRWWFRALTLTCLPVQLALLAWSGWFFVQ